MHKDSGGKMAEYEFLKEKSMEAGQDEWQSLG